LWRVSNKTFTSCVANEETMQRVASIEKMWRWKKERIGWITKAWLR
jgi:hypothetical protein